jgi:hypothetical protein
LLDWLRTQKTQIFALDQIEAIARHASKQGYVLDMYRSPRNSDAPLSVENVQTFCYARSPNAEQLSKHFVREQHIGRLQRIRRDEKPSSQSLQETMDGIAGSGLRGLQEHDTYVA